MQTSERHGHLEGRALHAFPVEPDALNFPFARSLGVVRSEVIVNKPAKPPPSPGITSPANGPTNALPRSGTS